MTRGKGYGEYANFFTSDWSVTHVRLEIYCKAARANEIVDAIMDAAQTGLAGDGIVAVIPVEEVYRIRTKTQGNGDNV
ncbi:MAG: P-II family nitrogen regulator [Syntrophales bacterium]